MPKHLKTKEDYVRSVLKDRFQGAKKRNRNDFGIETTETILNVDYLYEVYQSQGGRCVYTGVPLVAVSRMLRQKKKRSRENNFISIDRIDSSKPYQKGNIQFVTFLFNKMKQDNSNKQLFDILKSVKMFRYYGYLSRIRRVK